MKKSRLISLSITVASMSLLCLAQSTKLQTSSSRPAADPLENSTKSITPKSAMPAHRKSSAVLPPTTGKNTTAELTHLENQKVKSGNTSNVGKNPAKGTSNKPADTSVSNGPAIDYKYQKPAGGKQAVTPNANVRNSSTPRVKKN